MEDGTSTSVDSGVQATVSPNKRRKIEQNSQEAIIVEGLHSEVAKFGALVSSLVSKKERTSDDYRALYRLYKAAVKALLTLETECGDLEEELKPLPDHAEQLLQSTNNENVKVWSEFFYKNQTPTKIKRVNSIPSPPTARIGGLLHAIGSFFGLTAEAVCSNKRKPDNRTNMEHLLKVARTVLILLSVYRDQIEKELEPYMREKSSRSNEVPVV